MCIKDLKQSGPNSLRLIQMQRAKQVSIAARGDSITGIITLLSDHIDVTLRVSYSSRYPSNV